jgi:hypothetical protein
LPRDGDPDHLKATWRPWAPNLISFSFKLVSDQFALPCRWRSRSQHHKRTLVFCLKEGKSSADRRVENSLYERATGYSYNAVKICLPYGSREPVYAPYVEHMPPDTTAAIFWLKNLDPARWRDVWQLEHVTGKYVVSDKTLSEDERIRARGA